MKQGVITKNKVKLFLKGNTTGYQSRQKGVGKRKTVRGCIISQDIAVVNLIIIKKGEQSI